MLGFGTKLVREARSASVLDWPQAPVAPAISEHEVHLWKVDLSPTLKGFECRLSQGELDHAARFYPGKDRQRYLNAHASLRIMLGRYLKLAPESLVFAQTDYGKPFLINHEAAGLLFNLSYTKDIALIAVAREREVGVDVEFINPDFALNEVAENFFSVAEVFTLSGLEQESRTRAFFDCWTRKEAYVKARGEGLSVPVDQFDVSLAPGVPAAMLANRADETETSRWIFHDLNVAANYAGALVIESLAASPRLSYFALS